MEIIPQKQCSRKDNCLNPLGSWLPATTDYFNSDRNRLRGECKLCQKEYNRVYRLDNLDRERRNKNRWREEHPEEQKAANKASYDRNKEQWKTTRKKYDQSHKEQRRAIGRRHYRNHPSYYSYAERKRRQLSHFGIIAYNARRRSRLFDAEGVHNGQDVLLQYKSQKGLCWWCGKPVGDNYHVDHRVALARGGSNWPNNICISCPSCNLSKGAKMPHEWNGRLL